MLSSAIEDDHQATEYERPDDGYNDKAEGADLVHKFLFVLERLAVMLNRIRLRGQ